MCKFMQVMWPNSVTRETERELGGERAVNEAPKPLFRHDSQASALLVHSNVNILIGASSRW